MTPHQPEEDKAAAIPQNAQQPDQTWNHIWRDIAFIGGIGGCATIPAIIGNLLQPYIGFVNMLAITFPYTVAAAIIFFIVPKFDWQSKSVSSALSVVAIAALIFFALFALSYSLKLGGITDSDDNTIATGLLQANNYPLAPMQWIADSVVFLVFYLNKYGAIPFLIATAGAAIIARFLQRFDS